jgi:hypothetical protein
MLSMQDSLEVRAITRAPGAGKEHSACKLMRSCDSLSHSARYASCVTSIRTSMPALCDERRMGDGFRGLDYDGGQVT